MIASEKAWVGQDIAKNRYRIDNQISQTNMACSYLAYDRRLQTKVVVKTPRPELVQRDPKLSERFTNQVQTMVRLACPHIISVLDFGNHGNLPFVVLQYLEGGSLENWIRTKPNRERQPQSVVRLHKWLLDVASTLDFIHQNNYVHRDIQPANILFDGQQHVFLADFGVVKALSDNANNGRMLTTIGQEIIGTPAYMAPELIQGHKVDGAIDQWSLAVTVYEFLAGRLPFSGQTPVQVLQCQTQRKPLPLPQIRPDLPDQLWPALNRALSIKREDRYPTCTQFARAILQTVEEAPRAAVPANVNNPTPPPIDKTVLQTAPPAPSQPQPRPQVAPQQFVTANMPGPPQQPFRQTTPNRTVTDQVAARRQRVQPPSRSSSWTMYLGVGAAAVILTAVLMCVIGKTQQPRFLANLFTPSGKTSGDGASNELDEAQAETNRYKKLLQIEKDRADKQEQQSRIEISNLQADVDREKSRFSKAEQSVKAYKAVFMVENKTKYNVVFEVRYRMWDGSFSPWKQYKDKPFDKNYTYYNKGALEAQLRVDETVNNNGIDWKTYTITCEMVPSYKNVNDLNTRNRYYFETYESGGRTYVKLMHRVVSS